MMHEKNLTMCSRFYIGVILLSTHEIAFADVIFASMDIYSGALLIPGAIAALIVKEKRAWWFLSSIPLSILSVFLGYTVGSVNPFIFLSIPFLLIPLAILQNKIIKNKQTLGRDDAS